MSWDKKLKAPVGGQKAARLLDDTSLPDIEEALRKARRMVVGDCLSWADSALSSIGRNITEHGRELTGSGDYLRAARADAAALYACLLAAEERQRIPPPSGVVPNSMLGVASYRQG